MLQGITFITDEKGNKNALIINLKKYKNICEDFFDVIISENRKKEPRFSMDDVKKELQLL